MPRKDAKIGADGALGTADDRRAYMRWGHEMNGGWYPWSKVIIGHRYLSHNYIGHTYIGHDYVSHNYVGHNYIGP